MRRTTIILLLWMLALAGVAQTVISGHVMSRLTESPLGDAEVHVGGSNISVITNEDGFFSLKLQETPRTIYISALGHKTSVVDCSTLPDLQNVNVWLAADGVMLNTVFAYSPENIIEKALEKIPQNFTPKEECLTGFYRETVKKKNHFTNINEAVISIFKTGYRHNIDRDKVQVIKGRSLMSQKKADTLSIKIMGGPHEAVLLDMVKNRDILFYEKDLPAYRFKMEEGTIIDGRPQFVISFYAIGFREYPLYSGTIYIDMERVAFTRIEAALDVSDVPKAVEFMLVKKPRGLRFRPKGLTTTVSFRYDGEYSRLHYVRNIYLFNCDWKRRLFATSYKVVSEIVVTDYKESPVPKSSKGMFGHNDTLSSDVADFNDETFWKDYNILEPSESLENAVRKLKKRQ